MADELFSTHQPTYLGYVVGIRAMWVVKDKLMSPQQHYRWHPGINNAGCLYRDQSNQLRVRTIGVGPNGQLVQASRVVNHHVAMRECTCGFYSYWDPKFAHQYMPENNGVFAIVKAYGTLTYGTQGYRASKVEVLALAYNGGRDAPPKPVRPKPPGFKLLFFGIALSILVLITGIALAFSPLPFPIPMLIAWSAGGPLWLFGKISKWRIRRYDKATTAFAEAVVVYRRYLDGGWNTTITPEVLDQVALRYPEIKIFDSVDEALAAYPLTNPESIVKPDLEMPPRSD